MGKKALCIKKADLNAYLSKFESNCNIHRQGPDWMFVKLDRPDIFFNLKSELVDRDICESDMSWQQLLVYIGVCKESIPGAAEPRRYLCYRRGKAGEESKLHGNHSIGLGGHCEEAPPPGEGFFEVLASCGKREVVEEIGVKNLGPEIRNKLSSDVWLIIDRSNPVGTVHLGIYIEVELTGEVGQAETDVIESLRWISQADIVGDPTLQPAAFESWSQIVLDIKSDKFRI